MGNKGKLYTAIAGLVVGAGAAIVGAKVLTDRKNQKKIGEVIAKGKEIARKFTDDVNSRADETREVVDESVKVGTKKANKLIKVVKTAEKGVKNI